MRTLWRSTWTSRASSPSPGRWAVTVSADRSSRCHRNLLRTKSRILTSVSARNLEGRAHPLQAGSAGDRTAVVIDTLATSEDHETAAWRDLAAAASRHGLAADERGRAFLMAAPGCPIPAFNRVVGIGRHGPATIDEIRE